MFIYSSQFPRGVAFELTLIWGFACMLLRLVARYKLVAGSVSTANTAGYYHHIAQYECSSEMETISSHLRST